MQQVSSKTSQRYSKGETQVSFITFTNDECLHLLGESLPVKEVRHPQRTPTGNKGGLLQTANLAVESLAALGARHKIKEKEKAEKRNNVKEHQQND